MEEEMEKLRVVELKELLREKGLVPRGKKADLIRMLKEARAGEEAKEKEEEDKDEDKNKEKEKDKEKEKEEKPQAPEVQMSQEEDIVPPVVQEKKAVAASAPPPPPPATVPRKRKAQLSPPRPRSRSRSPSPRNKRQRQDTTAAELELKDRLLRRKDELRSARSRSPSPDARRRDSRSSRSRERRYDDSRHRDYRYRDDHRDRYRDRDHRDYRDHRDHRDYRDRDYRDRDRYRDRDYRDRDRHRRHRDDTPEPERQHREERRRNRKTGWDVRTLPDGSAPPPPGAAAARGGHAAAGSSAPLSAVRVTDPTLVAPDGSEYPNRGAPSGGDPDRQARRLYVGGLARDTTESALGRFINERVARVEGRPLPASVPPVVGVSVPPDKTFAFVELASHEDAEILLCLDGAECRGARLVVRRPKDYRPPPGAPPPRAYNVSGGRGAPGGAGAGAGGVPQQMENGPEKLFLGGLPTALSASDVQQLVAAFGELAGFQLIADRETGASRGFAFFKYVNPAHSLDALTQLHRLEMAGSRLTCERSGAKKSSGAGAAAGPPPDPTASFVANLALPPPPPDAVREAARNPTRVLQMVNMVTPDMLRSDEEYEELRDEIGSECASHGRMERLVMPRPGTPTAAHAADVGKVFVVLESAADARAVDRVVNGRKFDGRIILTSFVDPDEFLRRYPAA